MNGLTASKFFSLARVWGLFSLVATLGAAPYVWAQASGAATSAASPFASQTSPAQATPAQTGPTAPQTGGSPPTTAPSGAAQGQPGAAPSDANQPGQGDEPVTTIFVPVNEVNLIFTVTDKKGHFITGLKQSDFGLLDDGRPPEAVLRFSQQTNLPLRVGIMLDTSSSIRQRFQFEQDSAFEFLLQIIHRNDRAFVEGFDVETDITQPFTNNIDLLNQGVRKLRPGGGTAFYDALYKTCHEQMLTLRDPNSVRKALILVSDGEDNYSHALESDAIRECQRADTIVYAISTDVSPTRTRGDDVLRAIAEATGGQAFYPTKIEDVATGFKNIEEALRSQYSLVYRPAEFKDDGSFRTIYLKALDPQYHVRAQKGYFAPRAPQAGE